MYIHLKKKKNLMIVKPLNHESNLLYFYYTISTVLQEKQKFFIKIIFMTINHQHKIVQSILLKLKITVQITKY